MQTPYTKAQFSEEQKSWFVTGFGGYKYWGATARDAEQNAVLNFYK